MKLQAKDAGLLSTVAYTAGSLLAALIFLLATVLTGDYGWVSRIGGAVWIFALSMIILMPTVTPLVRGRLEPGYQPPPGEEHTRH